MSSSTTSTTTFTTTIVTKVDGKDTSIPSTGTKTTTFDVKTTTQGSKSDSTSAIVTPVSQIVENGITQAINTAVQPSATALNLGAGAVIIGTGGEVTVAGSALRAGQAVTIGTFTVSIPDAAAATGSASNGPSSSPTSTGAAKAVKGKSGIPAGPAAGIAIGCLIAGALIASLVFFLLRSRRGRKEHGGSSYAPAPVGYSSDKKATTVTVSLPENSSAAIVENYLPQPKEDNAITGDLSKLKNKIEGHIQTFYHTGPANDQAATQALSQALGGSSPIPVSRLATLLANPRSRPAVLRSALAWVIITKIELESNPRETFLPAQVTGAVQNLPSGRMDDKTRMAFLSKWRQITSTLSGNLFVQDTMAEDDTRLINIRQALQAADTFLLPYASSADQETRLRNLEEIMKRAARFGFLLFSQPSTFRFDWNDNGAGMVVFPGLLQVAGDNGEVLPGGVRTFAQKEIVVV